MVIAPGTKIYLISGCPLDDRYEHTIFWDTNEQTKQKEFFSGARPSNEYPAGFTVQSFINQTYQRVEKGFCRVEAEADRLYNVNYMVFVNESFNGKWFYCFVQSVEYINNKVTQINFTVDVLQTFHYDYTLPTCFVERNHVYDDTPGRNIIEENIERGEYFFDDLENIDLGENYIVVVSTVKPADDEFGPFDPNNLLGAKGGGIYNGIYNGLFFNVFKWAKTVNEFIEALTTANKIDSVVTIMMIPAKFFVSTAKPIDYLRNTNNWTPTAQSFDGGTNGVYGEGGYSASTYTYNPNHYLYGYTKPRSIGGYTPRNNKLLTSPYCVLHVTNNNGQTADYRYEFFGGLWDVSCDLDVVCIMSASPESIIYPVQYKGVLNNYVEKLVVNDFPICSFVVDTFKAWLAQNQTQLLTSFAVDVGRITTGLGGIVGAVATEQPVLGTASSGMIRSGLESILNKVGIIEDHKTKPPHANGIVSNSVNTALGIQGFRVYRARITEGYAGLIDGFFDKFGYAKNRFESPERNNRPHYTYLKTMGCEIIGSIPNKYSKQICGIYDAGCTWWRYGKEVGDYSLAAQNLAPVVDWGVEYGNNLITGTHTNKTSANVTYTWSGQTCSFSGRSNGSSYYTVFGSVSILPSSITKGRTYKVSCSLATAQNVFCRITLVRGDIQTTYDMYGNANQEVYIPLDATSFSITFRVSNGNESGGSGSVELYLRTS